MAELGPAAAMLAATLGLGQASASPAEPDAAPVSLVTDATTSGVVVQVVGHADAATDVSYALEMVSGAPANSNRSTQRGSARLRAGERVVLLTARLGGAAGRDWRALLTVTPAAGEPYKIERQGS